MRGIALSPDGLACAESEAAPPNSPSLSLSPSLSHSLTHSLVSSSLALTTRNNPFVLILAVILFLINFILFFA